ncbi:hypothetical protein DACRYDRAFT_14482 [Dacryopinax primogenitus]|uniref:Uncharacterized protein n=1 Tax=Dacryopinax primogenitus (strain DJM 731) TaxID=1858805 RepID=M5G6R4_DACPD|nr:uncharacterized protein DACRYDRAFT_14482 [Dacryopinax primogenitus]EJU04394.1 hypothetical protein DACRYDRAFT_14482 [Dacryopinax primogenitus]
MSQHAQPDFEIKDTEWHWDKDHWDLCKTVREGPDGIIVLNCIPAPPPKNDIEMGQDLSQQIMYALQWKDEELEEEVVDLLDGAQGYSCPWRDQGGEEAASIFQFLWRKPHSTLMTPWAAQTESSTWTMSQDIQKFDSPIKCIQCYWGKTGVICTLYTYTGTLAKWHSKLVQNLLCLFLIVHISEEGMDPSMHDSVHTAAITFAFKHLPVNVVDLCYLCLNLYKDVGPTFRQGGSTSPISLDDDGWALKEAMQARVEMMKKEYV